MKHFRQPDCTEIGEINRQELHTNHDYVRAQIAIERGKIQKQMLREVTVANCSLAADIVVVIVTSWWKNTTAASALGIDLRQPPLVPEFVSIYTNILKHACKIGELAAGLPALDATYEIGHTYTSLLSKSTRAKGGLFFTLPRVAKHLVDLAVENGIVWTTAKVLEPSCGGGVLLIAVAERMIEEIIGQSSGRIVEVISKRLVGYELDPVAAWLAQVAVDAALLPYVNRAEELPVIVQVCDTLSVEARADFDLVIGNPPYGKIKLSEHMKKKFSRSTFGHANAYGLFFDQAARFTRESGKVVFITPASFLAGQYSKNLRSMLRTDVAPTTLELISSRNGIFEGVQQELVISSFKQGSSDDPVSVRRLDKTPQGGFEVTTLGQHLLPADLRGPWMIPRASNQVRLARSFSQFKSTLSDWGYQASTGPIVWNRFKDRITCQTHASSVPLIWAEAIQKDGELKWKAERKSGQKWFALEEVENKFLCQERCLLLQRTTSIEQARRLVVAELPKELIEQYGGVVIENHITMIRATSEKPRMDLTTLHRFLTSEAADQMYRCISGTTSVSASELSAMPLPDAENLSVLVGLVREDAEQVLIEEECWRLALSGCNQTQKTNSIVLKGTFLSKRGNSEIDRIA